MLVPNVVWIVIEDSKFKTSSVTHLLKRCRINSVHLNATTPAGTPITHGKGKPVKFKLRGVMQRNTGLEWLRGHHGNSSGVVYFADDDNKYDLRLFEEVSYKHMAHITAAGWPMHGEDHIPEAVYF